MLVTGLTFISFSAAGDKSNPAADPKPRDKGWVKRHEGFVAIAKKGDVDVLFLGDSITDAWRGKAAKPTWDKLFAPLKAANFGIGGDQTQHVLWRITNGELDGITPKVAVLMIGTNNLGGHSAEQIAGGVTAIVKSIQEKSPTTKIMLLAIFPRDAGPDSPRRAKIADINKMIAKLDDGKKVRYLDIGKKFLEADGTLPRTIMPDLLHLSARGYEIWGEAIDPLLHEMLGTKK
jgi:lysophospholipase L1-like esterase